ncbi:phenoloxidase-activating factor 2-like isoform X1 [Penaeus chinensis]|uniref:phenoloxidase-activating factor 2-like isoform X1 n=2 Tax=Penaeus chinensis TaxID=139456 RepID=UPI001FB709A8|nr:phenoloxidase-activating factor 2-like isoform X1 [Penaeus chinensis]
MNRLWLLFALALPVASGATSRPRLGILATELNVSPVPGGLPGTGDQALPPGCFCIPVNQVCPFRTDVRIALRPVAERCPDMKECCSSKGVTSLPPTSPLGSCGRQSAPREVIHGPALFGELPWMTMVLNRRGRYVAGGALISSEWVLTAAHRIRNQGNLIVRLGELDFSKPQDSPRGSHQDVPIDNIIVHPQFNPQTLANDVALLHLSRPANAGIAPHIGPVCLPSQGQIFQGRKCAVSGWGGDPTIPGNTFQNVLRVVQVPMVDPFACQQRLGTARLGANFTLDQTSFVCAGGVEGNDACTGDGGSPLVCQNEDRSWTLVGLVAWGLGCAQREVPGVYVNVASYANFIRQIVRF